MIFGKLVNLYSNFQIWSLETGTVTTSMQWSSISVISKLLLLQWQKYNLKQGIQWRREGRKSEGSQELVNGRCSGGGGASSAGTLQLDSVSSAIKRTLEIYQILGILHKKEPPTCLKLSCVHLPGEGWAGRSLLIQRGVVALFKPGNPTGPWAGVFSWDTSLLTWVNSSYKKCDMWQSCTALLVTKLP